MTRHRHPALRRASRIAFYVFLVAVAWLLVRAARAIDWGEVRAVLASLDAATLVAALALTAVSYAVYACYDVAARAYAGHTVRTTRVLTIADGHVERGGFRIETRTTAIEDGPSASLGQLAAAIDRAPMPALD